ncbi:DUF3274 domain-containing protein [Variovorax sp. PAMC28562]|uniref:T6SS effector phospholipase Tle3 domain-containing protein n=1 Tax=Variovorax sp. PAMC28562 TaxID=2762323 RepID=UPI00164EB15F|nr:DUF3274 domain-containing protein [Variovorax sp. PAMC28562]QNK72401.1 DUF3274 domain-containing protein [Variovorax sp. PAMC28562]
MSDLVNSDLLSVKLDTGKATWAECRASGRVERHEEQTHGFAIPDLMPATMIFVHGVNSEGEWYRDAAQQFAKGLNMRLGRNDLAELRSDPDRLHRLMSAADGERIRSPIIPFYWGYSVPEKQRRKLVDDPKKFDTKDTRHSEVWRDTYGNPLRKDGTWGGGPFQNGSGSLTSCWLPEGFRVKVLAHTLKIDVNKINPVLGRQLVDCPDRMYYVHAARRLAFLVKEIRQGHPREPINIVSHSQGTMIALLSLFYMKEMGIRGPDTVILNSTPYRFDNLLTDWLSAAGGFSDMQTDEARVKTFQAAAEYLKASRNGFDGVARLPDVDCSHGHAPKHPYDDKLWAQVPDTETEWEADIGNVEIERTGKKWWQIKDRYRDDSRGTLYVNFNPQDRVIGVSAVAGIGWRGIPPSLLDKGKAILGGNVKQRLFARGNDPVEAPKYNRAVGSDSSYRQDYFYEQIKYEPVQVDSGGVLVSSDGLAVQTEESGWHYLDGSAPDKAWKIASEKILGLMPVHGSVGLQYGSFYGDGGKSEYVYINAPVVPSPAVLSNDFDGDLQPYDGQAMSASAGNEAIPEDPEQQEDFEDDVTYQTPRFLEDKGRYETWGEVYERRDAAVGKTMVSPTNHSRFLRYRDKKTGISTVAQVLSYDLCLGRGYAWNDPEFWDYLIKLADWKVSDPYYKSGELAYERQNCTKPPAGVATETIHMQPPAPSPRDPAMR